MLRLATLLSLIAVATLTGCQSSGAFNPMAGYGPTRIAPPATNSSVQPPDIYYNDRTKTPAQLPAAGSTSRNQVTPLRTTPSQVTPSRNMVAIGTGVISNSQWQPAGTSAALNRTLPMTALAGNSSTISVPREIPNSVVPNSVMTASLEKRNVVKSSQNTVQEAPIRVADSRNGATAPISPLSRMPANDATRISAPLRFNPPKQPKEISRIARRPNVKRANFTPIIRLRGFAQPLQQNPQPKAVPPPAVPVARPPTSEHPESGGWQVKNEPKRELVGVTTR